MSEWLPDKKNLDEAYKRFAGKHLLDDDIIDIIRFFIDAGELVPRDHIIDFHFMGTPIPEWRNRAIKAESQLGKITTCVLGQFTVGEE